VTLNLGASISLVALLLPSLVVAVGLSDTYRAADERSERGKASGARLVGWLGLTLSVGMGSLASIHVLRAHRSPVLHHRVPAHDWQALLVWVSLFAASLVLIIIVSRRRRAARADRQAILG
jgi:hypothetical protein